MPKGKGILAIPEKKICFLPLMLGGLHDISEVIVLEKCWSHYPTQHRSCRPQPTDRPEGEWS